VQEPVHAPVLLLQRCAQAMPLFCQLPALSQSCGWSALHCLAPGVQALHEPPVHSTGQALPMFCQTPLLSHS